jgi:hypothetical protein
LPIDGKRDELIKVFETVNNNVGLWSLCDGGGHRLELRFGIKGSLIEPTIGPNADHVKGKRVQD